jgi:hypothetical protein
VRHGQFFPRDHSTLPSPSPALSRWQRLPPANRRRLVWLLSQLLQRQLERRAAWREEGGHDADARPR